MINNYSFEEVIDCQILGGDIEKSKGWFQPLKNVSTSDIFSRCSISPTHSTPNNFIGRQFALNDTSYSGIAFYYPNWGPEYIETKLTSPLKKNYTYCVEFYVSLADTCNYGISSIGCHFSLDSLLSICSSPCQINVPPQVQNDSLNIITDKVNWTMISGSFVAIGGEQFLTIGNFYDDSYTKRHCQKVSNYISGWNEGAYYYIDNVSVYACDSPVVEEPKDTSFVFIPNVFSPNQDGENDLWQVTASKVSSLNIQVFNRWGEQVYMFNSQSLQQDTSNSLSVTYSPAWDGYTPTGKPVPEGTYFYIIQYTLPSGETKVEKGNLALIR